LIRSKQCACSENCAYDALYITAHVMVKNVFYRAIYKGLYLTDCTKEKRMSIV